MNEITNILPAKYAAYFAALVVITQFLGRGYHALASGKGIIGAWRAFLYGNPNPPSKPESTGTTGTGGAAGLIIAFLLLAAMPARAWDFTNKLSLEGATNVAFIPFAKYDLQSHQFGYGAAGLYKVSDVFWTGLRVDRINGFQTSAGVQGQLQQTVKWNSFTITLFIEASAGIGNSSLYGSAGTGAFIPVVDGARFWLAGDHVTLNLKLVGDFEHVVTLGKKSNQVNTGPLIQLNF